jgi:hypothetical protein
MAPAVLATPRGPDHKESHLMANTSLAQPKLERMCRILREAEERYRNELLDDEERMLLLDRIKRLRRRLEA